MIVTISLIYSSY